MTVTVVPTVKKAYQKLDTEMIGLVKKKKEKIKPGYKKKIQWKVDEKRKRERRAANRAKGRAERKAKSKASKHWLLGESKF